MVDWDDLGSRPATPAVAFGPESRDGYAGLPDHILASIFASAERRATCGPSERRRAPQSAMDQARATANAGKTRALRADPKRKTSRKRCRSGQQTSSDALPCSNPH